MYPYRFNTVQNKEWQYLQGKNARSVLKTIAKQGFKVEQITLQTTIGETQEWVTCPHLQDDLRISCVGPDGQCYPSFIDAANAVGRDKNTISRWARRGFKGWRLAGVADAAVC